MSDAAPVDPGQMLEQADRALYRAKERPGTAFEYARAKATAET